VTRSAIGTIPPDFVGATTNYKGCIMNIRHLLPIMLVAIAAQAQITLLSADYQNVFKIGNTIVTDTARNGALVDLGSAGSSAQTFDFSNVVFDATTFNQNVVAAAGSKYADSFPAAEFAVVFNVPGYSSYTYEKATSTQVLSYGSASAFGVFKSSPAEPAFVFPLTYNSSWTYQSDSMSVPGAPGAKTLRAVSNHVDAF